MWARSLLPAVCSCPSIGKTIKMDDHSCQICGTRMRSTIASWHWVCPGCRYENSELTPKINDLGRNEVIDEGLRETGLRELRLANFELLLKELERLGIHSGKLLDVGSAHGWFLELAGKKFNVLGIEPDAAMFRASSSRKLPVRGGFFPEALRNDERFDVIVFNDVFEHIPNAAKTLADCNRYLNDNGILVLNLPDSAGFFYKLSKVLHRMGVSAFFDRMWQKDFPSPHLHYFNIRNLDLLLTRNNFRLISGGRLPTIHAKGLFTRISYASKSGVIGRILVYAGILISLPILNIVPSDISYIIAIKKRDD